MALPLYQALHDGSISKDDDFHRGLWFERFASVYNNDWSLNETGRKTWLQKMATHSLGDAKQLEMLTWRQRQLVTSQQGQAGIFTCQGRFVTGLGNAHPLENGFTWHPTLGMPYLPGSAVKGLLRAAVEQHWQAPNEREKNALLARWFGCDDPQQSGAFIFLDALPTGPCRLEPEVMTPHMGQWYSQGHKQPLDPHTQPGDWHSPVPVFYLTARNLTLQFAVLCRDVDAQPELGDVFAALGDALQWFGAGAKTAQGFGRFNSDEKSNRYLQEVAEQQQREQEKTERHAQLSPSEQRLEALREQFHSTPEGCAPGSQAHTELQNAIDTLANAQLQEGTLTERQAMVALIREEMKLRKLKFSKKKEKGYKALLQKLSE